MQHLNRDDSEQIRDFLMRGGTVARSLYDIRTENTPVRNSFELKDEYPIYSRGRRLPPKHNKDVCEEFGKSFKAGTVTPATSAW